MSVLRRKITGELAKWKANPKRHPLLVAGARQVGKTFAICDFAEKSYESRIYMNFEESPSLRRIFDGDLDADTLVMKITARFGDAKIIPGRTVLILDEIQSCPQARTAMKSLSGDPRLDVIATGSLPGLNHNKVSLYPTGYEEYMDMRSMDFEEFLWAIGIGEGTISDASGRLRRGEPLDPFVAETLEGYYRMHMAVGGMPEVVEDFAAHRDFGRVRAIQRKILRSYEDDVSKYAKGIDGTRARECLRSVPGQIGRRFRYSEVTGARGARRSMYDGGIEWLIGAGVVFKCYKAADLSLPIAYSRDMGLFKLYLHDTGLLTAMMEGGTASMLIEGEGGANWGKVAENAAACEIAGKGIEPMYFEQKDLEIDFVAALDGRAALIEVKSGSGRGSKSLDSMMSKMRGRARGIKFEREGAGTGEDGIERYPLFAAAFVFPDDSGYKL
jgi:predicted AAA+ superfamily ATPase